MAEDRLMRIGREIFLAAFGIQLEKVDPWVIDRLTSILEEQEVHRGQTLCTEGEPIAALYFMQNGEVRFTRDGGPSWTLRGRWIIGGLEALTDRHATRTATAMVDFYGVKVPAVDGVEMLEDSSPLARLAVMNVSRALMRTEERVPTGAPASPREPSPLPEVPWGTLSQVERLALLLDVRMLRAAGVQALADLAAVSKQVAFGAGDLLVERGVEQENMIQVVEGGVLAECDVPAMERRYGPCDLVCGAAILGQVASRWQARAVAPSRGISFPISGLFDLMEEHFDLVRSTLAALAVRRELLLEHLAAESGDLVLT